MKITDSYYSLLTNLIPGLITPYSNLGLYIPLEFLMLAQSNLSRQYFLNILDLDNLINLLV